MKLWINRAALCSMLCLGLCLGLIAFTSADEPFPDNQILIVVGPSKHPPGSHEVEAGAHLMKYCLENMTNLPGVQVTVTKAWPKDPKLLDSVKSVVFIGDTFPPGRMPETDKILADLSRMMDRGCGIACIHYATGLLGKDVAPDGDHPLLRWMGGYFANRSCPHHESIARIFAEATITPAAPEHPICRGWKEFTLHDEPYIENYFGKDGNKLGPGVTALATSMLPPESPNPQIVAWCIERPDHGRGFANVMPHFYKNWRNEDLRRFIVNGIAWTAHLEVPAGGIDTTIPDLKTFNPAALEVTPKKEKAKS